MTTTGTPRAALLLAFLAASAATVYYGVIYEGQLPDHRWVSGSNDLILHAAAFAVLTGTALLMTPRRTAPLLALALFAGAIEGVQIFQLERNATLSDFAASLSGIAAAVLIVALARKTLDRIARAC